MKIVQFKNGKYGIRKWTLFGGKLFEWALFGGYSYLGKNLYEGDDLWWSIIDYVPKYCVMSKEEVIDRWQRYPLRKDLKVQDKGTVVSLKELSSKTSYTQFATEDPSPDFFLRTWLALPDEIIIDNKLYYLFCRKIGSQTSVGYGVVSKGHWTLIFGTRNLSPRQALVDLLNWVNTQPKKMS